MAQGALDNEFDDAEQSPREVFDAAIEDLDHAVTKGDVDG